MRMKCGIFSTLPEMPEQSCNFSCASTRDRYSAILIFHYTLLPNRGSTALWIFQLREISRKFSQTRFASGSYALHYHDMTHGNLAWCARATTYRTIYFLYIWCIISHFFISETEYIKIKEHVNEHKITPRILRSYHSRNLSYNTDACNACFILFNIIISLLPSYYIITTNH